MKAQDICTNAAKIVEFDRRDQHGDIATNHQNIADMWSAWLGVDISPTDVAAMMIMRNLARTKTEPSNMDNYVDIAGYAGAMGEITSKTGVTHITV